MRCSGLRVSQRITSVASSRCLSMMRTEQLLSTWNAEFDDTVCLSHALCDRHPSDAVAVCLVDEDRNVTFGELSDTSKRLATVLKGLGVGPGDRVAGMLPKGTETLATIVAAARLGATYVPLFTAFGPAAVEFRVINSNTKVVITDTSQVSMGKVDGIGAEVQRITVGDDFASAVSNAEPLSNAATMCGDDMMSLVYTSGTTGQPKGVEVPVRALPSMLAYMRFGLDVRDDDIYWNVADPGWAYGLYYSAYAPLCMGRCGVPDVIYGLPSLSSHLMC